MESAVSTVLEQVDRLVSGEVLGVPPSTAVKALFDSHVETHGGSVKLACAFFSAYAVVDPGWDFVSVPTGIRGRYGDKKLGTELSQRMVTFHQNVTAFGENLGWKGNVREVDLSRDKRFAPFLAALRDLDHDSRVSLLRHVAWRLASSRVVLEALPPLPPDYLSYGRSLSLVEDLLAIPSEGHIPQFLVAAFLRTHRLRSGHRVITHHPHASDTYDGTLGDIEEYRDQELVAAYEVTVRDDWKNRLSDFVAKASGGGLSKYIIFAANVRSDKNLYPAHRLVEFIGHLPVDIAVVDLSDFFAVFCAELTREEIRKTLNQAYEYLSNPKLCGRSEFVERYKSVTNSWLDEAREV